MSRHTGMVRALAVAYFDTGPELVSSSDGGHVRRDELTAGGGEEDTGDIGTVAPATRLASDSPSRVDACGRDTFVEALYGFLTDPQTEAPVVVSVEGPWGYGKTSVLTQLRDRLDPAHRNKRMPGVTHRLVTAEHQAGTQPPRHTRGGLSPLWALKRLGEHGRPVGAVNLGHLERLPAAGDTAGPTRLTVWFSPWLYHGRDELWRASARSARPGGGPAA